jgi:transposase
MVRPLSKDLRDRVVRWRIEDGKTYRELAHLANCSIGTISNILRFHHTFGQSTNPFGYRPGQPPLLNAGDMEFLDKLLEREPCLFLDELQDRLYDRHHKQVSMATLCRGISKLNISRKRVTKQAAERNEYLRAIWEGEMAQYDDPDLFIFLDESSVDNKTGQRNNGRSHRGTPCVRRATFIRGTRYSILPALTVDGIMAMDIFPGSVDRERFLQFLREQVVRTILHSSLVIYSIYSSGTSPQSISS